MEENAKIRNKEKRRLRGKPTNNNYHHPEPGDLTAGPFFIVPLNSRVLFSKNVVHNLTKLNVTVVSKKKQIELGVLPKGNIGNKIRQKELVIFAI